MVKVGDGATIIDCWDGRVLLFAAVVFEELGTSWFECFDLNAEDELGTCYYDDYTEIDCCYDY